jgi:hypothetical protein
MREPNCSPRGPRLYGHREERKQACREVLRAENRVAIAVQLEEEPLVPGLMLCPKSGRAFCREECCEPDWSDPRDDEVFDFPFDIC